MQNENEIYQEYKKLGKDINNYDDLNKMYNNKNEDLLYFLKLFRKYLSEYLGKDIKYLRDANTCINKSKIKTVYERIII